MKILAVLEMLPFKNRSFNYEERLLECRSNLIW